ncbi:MAG TPA: hypothetical protein DEU93_00470 [Chitinophagaceae bacterium]|nr:hypothetical protein [Chitinophagaceae bacterium]HML57980.1 hypothetical protein [Ferruginibacter sp.]
MALNAAILGEDLNNRAAQFNDVDIADLNAARAAYWQTIAEGIIEHFKTYGQITVPGLGLVAPSGGGPVTGSSTTGSLQ